MRKKSKQSVQSTIKSQQFTQKPHNLEYMRAVGLNMLVPKVTDFDLLEAALG